MTWLQLLFVYYKLIPFFVQYSNSLNICAVNNVDKDENTSNNLNSNSQNHFPLGCAPKRNAIKEGLSMELYKYDYRYYQVPCADAPYELCWIDKQDGPCYDSSYLNFNYARYGYQHHQKIGEAEGVTGVLDFRFCPMTWCYVQYGTLPPAYNYPTPITISNFTLIMYGYFKPTISGIYTFYIEGDDLLYLNFGAGNAFDCCKLNTTYDKFGNYQAYAIWGSDHVKNQLKVNLDADYYYPIRMFYNNRDYVAALSISFSIDNDPEKINDFTGYLYSVNDEELGCSNNIVFNSTCDNVLSPKTYSTQIIDKCNSLEILTDEITVYHIKIPCSTTATSVECINGFYDPLHNTCVPASIVYKSTFATNTTPVPINTETTLSSKTNNYKSITTNLPNVITITPRAAPMVTTSFEPGTRVGTETVTTISTYTVGTDNVTTPETIVVVKTRTPPAPVVTTSFEPGTRVGTETVTTISTYTVGTDNVTTPETIVVVKTRTPPAPVVTTSFEPGTRVGTETVTTISTYTVGTDNVTTPETIVVVKTRTPPAPVVTTSFEPGTRVGTETVTTISTYTVGTDNVTTPETIVVVKTRTPPAPVVTTSFEPGTRVGTETVTTISTYTVGTDNITTPETIVVIESFTSFTGSSLKISETSPRSSSLKYSSTFSSSYTKYVNSTRSSLTKSSSIVSSMKLSSISQESISKIKSYASLITSDSSVNYRQTTTDSFTSSTSTSVGKFSTPGEELITTASANSKIGEKISSKSSGPLSNGNWATINFDTQISISSDFQQSHRSTKDGVYKTPSPTFSSAVGNNHRPSESLSTNQEVVAQASASNVNINDNISSVKNSISKESDSSSSLISIPEYFSTTSSPVRSEILTLFDGSSSIKNSSWLATFIISLLTFMVV
ncbi:uncharacterized protein RNJ42_00852 [Nakaseomyces bracarensis]|uniref:uncharacterized protein n=1 Tax=Nakaseomyces bracarensis TaxID=273131 RepID=UPI00387110DD